MTQSPRHSSTSSCRASLPPAAWALARGEFENAEPIDVAEKAEPVLSRDRPASQKPKNGVY